MAVKELRPSIGLEFSGGRAVTLHDPGFMPKRESGSFVLMSFHRPDSPEAKAFKERYPNAVSHSESIDQKGRQTVSVLLTQDSATALRHLLGEWLNDMSLAT